MEDSFPWTEAGEWFWDDSSVLRTTHPDLASFVISCSSCYVSSCYGMSSDILLFFGHFGYYVRILWSLFKVFLVCFVFILAGLSFL